MSRSTITYRGLMRSATAWRGAALAAALIGFSGLCPSGHAQELLEAEILAPQAELLGTAPDSSVLLDAAPAPMTAYEATPYDAGAAAVYGADEVYGANSAGQTRPVNWISGPYLRGGVNFSLNDELFDVDQEVGYGISGGFRQPLGPEIGGDRFFFDLGGSFQNSYGDSTPVAIDGLQTTISIIPGVQPTFAILNDAFITEFEEIRRGSAHAAIGWFWGRELDNRSCDPQVRVATRIGGRIGHARGGFDETQITPTPAAPAFTTRALEIVAYNKTDTYGGIFVGTEAILLQRQFTFGHFQWTVDGEYANDWINIGNVWEGTLGTASVMTGFMLSR